MSLHAYIHMYYHSELDKTMSDTVSNLDPRLGQVIVDMDWCMANKQTTQTAVWLAVKHLKVTLGNNTCMCTLYSRHVLPLFLYTKKYGAN